MPTPIKKLLKAYKKWAVASGERRWRKFCHGDAQLMACSTCRAHFQGER